MVESELRKREREEERELLEIKKEKEKKCAKEGWRAAGGIVCTNTSSETIV